MYMYMCVYIYIHTYTYDKRLNNINTNILLIMGKKMAAFTPFIVMNVTNANQISRQVTIPMTTRPRSPHETYALDSLSLSLSL